MVVPKEYAGREQSYLKHRILDGYLQAWAQKHASNSRYGPVRLVYVDCFAGPWQSQTQKLEDTSVHIGLTALEIATRTWKSGTTAKALFVEKDDEAYARLQKHLGTYRGPVETLALHGEFGSQIEIINKHIGSSPAFLFVDPTGWKGVAMNYIAPLARPPKRDVLINVMFNHIRRFKDDPREFLRSQMREFFGLRDRDIPEGLDEDELLALYRRQLKQAAHLPYAANLAIPHPDQDRTWFHLVVGGHHHEVVRLFRSIESKVCGREAEQVRSSARSRRTSQSEMLFGQDATFDGRHEASEKHVREWLRSKAPAWNSTFLDVWTELLQENHLTRTELARLVLEEVDEGRIELSSTSRTGVADDTRLTRQSKT